MLENFRSFQVTDPFDRAWDVEFRWQQNGISIRHADTIDAKFWLTHDNEKIERVVALRHPDLLKLSAEIGRPLTDAWCLKLAALHLQQMVTNWEDMETTLVTAPYADLKHHATALQEAVATPR